MSYVRRLTSPFGSSSVRIITGFRSDVLLMKKAPSPATQQPCRVNLQQVPAVHSSANSWAGPWVWLVLCVTLPGICLAARAALHRPSSATWETTPRTIRCCTSYWAWVCPCCLFYKRYCCRCSRRLCLMSRALYSLRCFGCRSKSGTGSSSSSADPCCQYLTLNITPRCH